MLWFKVKASLEREVNHLRVRGPLPLTLDEFPTRDTDSKAEEGLRANMYQMAQKQNSIIQARRLTIGIWRKSLKMCFPADISASSYALPLDDPGPFWDDSLAGPVMTRDIRGRPD